MEVISALLVLLGVSQLRDFTISYIAEDYPLYRFLCENLSEPHRAEISVLSLSHCQSLSNSLTL